MTHTPEPWEILRHDLGDEEIFFVPAEIRGSNGKLVVAYEGGLAPAAHEWTAEEIEANASLIAGAPEMLEALEAMVEMVEMNGLGKRYALDLAASAIRKARGEE